MSGLAALGADLRQIEARDVVFVRRIAQKRDRGVYSGDITRSFNELAGRRGGIGT